MVCSMELVRCTSSPYNFSAQHTTYQQCLAKPLAMIDWPPKSEKVTPDISFFLTKSRVAARNARWKPLSKTVLGASQEGLGMTWGLFGLKSTEGEVFPEVSMRSQVIGIYLYSGMQDKPAYRS